VEQMKILNWKRLISICLILAVITGVLWIHFGDFNDRPLYEASFADFVSWMKNHNYSQSIIDIYECNYQDPVLKLIIEEYFKIKRGDLKWAQYSLIEYMKFKSADSLYLSFIEVIPTDKNAQFQVVDPVAVDDFHKYLQARFGKDIVMNHKKVAVNYNEVFGDIFYSYESLFKPKTNFKLADFIEQFEPPCIIKFDAEFINDKVVAGIWNIRRCAIIMGKDYRLVNDISIFDKYAHEFGHSIGLVHQFIDPDNPLRGNVDMETIRNNRGRYVGVDDIMIKSKMAENKAVGHYLSPLSRYALEPVNGYEDKDEFGAVYNSLYSQEVLERIKACACGE